MCKRSAVLSVLMFFILLTGAQAQQWFLWQGDPLLPTGDGTFSNKDHWNLSNEGDEGPPTPGDNAWFNHIGEYTVNVGGQSVEVTFWDHGICTFNGSYSSGIARVGNTSSSVLKLSGGSTLTCTEPSSAAMAIANEVATNGQLLLEGGGTTFTVTQGGTIIGHAAATEGLLSIKAGAHASITGQSANLQAILFGEMAQANGEGLIHGAGSRMDVLLGGLEIARAGQGSVSVQEGGTLAVNVGSAESAINIGVNSGGNGTLVADGNGSTIQILQGGLELGRAGFGQAYITGNAELTISGQNYITCLMGLNSTGSARLIVSGAGSKMTVGGGRMEVGRDGFAEVFLDQGALLDLQNHGAALSDMILGNGSTGIGRLTITDASSICNVVGALVVGGAGIGHLEVTDGGLAVGSPGTLALMVARDAGSSGDVVMSGSDSQIVIPTGQVVIGGAGHGTLDVGAGGRFEMFQAGDELIVGNASGADGTLTVSGADAEVKTKGKVVVGKGGKGSVVLKPFSLMTSTAGEIGKGGEGTVEVQDNAFWSCLTNGEFLVGGTGKGTLIVREEGQVTCLNGGTVVIGKEAGSEGTIYLIDGGSLFASHLEFGAGTGSLVLQGSHFTADSLTLGNADGALSSIYVEGDGAALFAEDLELGEASGTTGQLVVSATAEADIAGNLLVGGEGTGQCSIQMGSGLTVQRTTQINHGSLTVEGPGAFFHSDRLEVEEGTVLVGGILGFGSFKQFLSIGHAGVFELAGSGSAVVGPGADTSPVGTMTVMPGGTLNCSGLIKATVVNLGGSVHLERTPPVPNSDGALPQGQAPPPATTGIQGSYEQSAEGTLHLIITGTTAGAQYAQLIAESAAIEGKIILDFQQGFAPSNGQVFDLVQSPNTSISPNVTVEMRNIAPGFLYDLSVVDGKYRLTAQNDAVPMPVYACKLEHVPGLYLKVDYTGILQSSTDLVHWADVAGTQGTSFKVPQEEMVGQMFFRVRSF